MQPDMLVELYHVVFASKHLFHFQVVANWNNEEYRYLKA